MRSVLSLRCKGEEKFIEINFEDVSLSVDLEEFGINNNVRLSEIKTSQKSKLIEYLKVDTRKFFLYTSKSNILYLTDNINRFLRVRQNWRCKITNNHIYFYGKLTNIQYKVPDFDNVFLNGEFCTKIKRFSNRPKFKNLFMFKIKISDILETGEIHNSLRIGNNLDFSIPLLIKSNDTGRMKYLAQKKVGDNYILVRSVFDGNKIRITNIKFNPEYKKTNLLKNSIAYNLSKIIKNKKINLMFEKETSRACESGYYSFEKIMERQSQTDLNSKTFFVIDKNAPEYSQLKSKYGKNIVAKYSFRHYLYIYLSKYFISSELSNHVINPRLYIANLNQCISTKPLIFLQHGIMFSKPVDNPAAANFRKDTNTVNFYKSIISSDLEATQFYKCGFEDEDLIKCGLPKFDISKLNDDADKIMVMLTYRYWEESFVLDEEKIKETTYYKAYMRLLKAFEENDLLDKLLISCHPKFTDFLMNLNPKYAACVENDIAKALAESKIYITDYSSASYDAHYRGAYIIYDWEEKDYLIENYKAIPPINEDNCDGVPVFSMDQLIDEVKKAIDNDYVMDEKYEERYAKINEFRDGKNGDRLVDELIRLDVL